MHKANSSFAGKTDRADFHWSRNHQWSFRGVADGERIMHETTLYNGLVLQYNLVTITALKALLIPVTSMGGVLHLPEVPYYTELAHCCNQVPLLFTVFRNLLKQNRMWAIKRNHIKFIHINERRRALVNWTQKGGVYCMGNTVTNARKTSLTKLLVRRKKNSI